MKAEPSVNQGEFVVNQSQFNNMRSGKEKDMLLRPATAILAAKA